MKLSERSKKNLEGVHPDLVRLVRTVTLPSGYEAIVTEGMRTWERQQELLAQGKSQTQNSRHLTGHAIDIALVKNGEVTWEFDAYRKAADAFKDTSRTLGVPITWGGDWGFKDGTHFQLDWEAYPLAIGQKTAKTSTTVAAATAGGGTVVLLPWLLDTLGEISDLVGQIPPNLATWLQGVLAVTVIGYLVYERVGKIKREGV